VRAQGPVAELLTRTDLPLTQGDQASALIEARTCGLNAEVGMCALAFEGGQLLVPQTRAQPLPEHTRVRVRIQARDVSLSLDAPTRTSVLNVLPATVTDVQPDGTAQLQAHQHLGSAPGGARVLSRISRYSADRLGLTPGVRVFAQIKGVALVR
jgi:molybdate transport system ATP-binding protein